MTFDKSPELRVLYVGDGGEPARLSQALVATGASISIDYRITRVSLGISTALRHWRYLKMALGAALNSRGYDKIFFWQQYVALYYSVITGIFPWRRRKYIVYYIIGKKRRSLIGKIAEYLFTAMISGSEKTYFMSEADYLFRKLKGGRCSGQIEILNDLDLAYPYIEENRDPDHFGQYVFSGGSGNRAYSDIAAIAASLPDERFVIACRAEDVAGIALSENTSAYHNVYGDRFIDLILDAKVVILPLADPDVMSGQLVCIQAFAANKTVLISESNCLRDWIPNIDELDFVTLYTSTNECVDHILSLDPERVRAAGNRARCFYQNYLTNTGFYERLASQIASYPRVAAR